MKKHAAFFKNIAAFMMLTALLTLLLPLGKITTDTKSTMVSGAEVLKIGMNVGYEYYNKGSIEEDYVLSNSITWGDIKAGINYVAESGEAGNAVVAGIIAILPIICCFLAMSLTFIAPGKKTMLLATGLIALAFFENIVLIMIFGKLQQLLLPYIQVTLLMGMYAFTALSGIALMILSVLWITGGFFKPKEKNADSNEKKGRRKKKEKRKRRHKKKRRSKKTPKRDNGEKEKRYSLEQTKEKTNADSPAGNLYEGPGIHSTGRILGLIGMYQGMSMELSKITNGTITIGTTPESMEAIQKGNMSDLDRIAKNSCIIEYSEANKHYKVSSYSVTEIQLQMDGEDKNVMRLQYGESQVIRGNTLLCIGNQEHCIRLE